MFKYKITYLEVDKDVAEQEMNKLGAEGWQLVNIVEYDGRIIWCKVDLGELEGDATKLMKSLTHIAEDMVKDMDKDKKDELEEKLEETRAAANAI